MEFYRIISLGDNTSIPGYYDLLCTETEYLSFGASTITRTTLKRYIDTHMSRRSRAYLIDLSAEDKTHLKLLGIDVSIMPVIYGKRLKEVYHYGKISFRSVLQAECKKGK